uniref:WRKY domain-containing protein n=1 Tax=Oryza meridionalis TaxID=40149 RepID=A0A0E0C9J8_9ORYZ
MAMLGSSSAVVLELMTMGYQSAAYLGELLRAASPAQAGDEQQELAAEILRCCDRVIAKLSRGGATGATTGKKRKAAESAAAAAAVTSSSLPVTPTKRRARGAEAVREVRSGTTADGFIWRKYGQKEINGCKHPRLYYRCAFRGQGCLATRRVQQSQSQDDPAAAFVIAYYGEHTCGGGAAAAACRDGELMPPAVINSGASSFAAAWNMGSREPASSLAVERRSCDGDAPSETSQGWSPSLSSEVELDVLGFDLAGADSSASLVWEFLNGSFDWESVINSL